MNTAPTPILRPAEAVLFTDMLAVSRALALFLGVV
jgi:hypothetical protein